jgi:hypothetical protein
MDALPQPLAGITAAVEDPLRPDPGVFRPIAADPANFEPLVRQMKPAGDLLGGQHLIVITRGDVDGVGATIDVMLGGGFGFRFLRHICAALHSAHRAVAKPLSESGLMRPVDYRLTISLDELTVGGAWPSGLPPGWSSGYFVVPDLPA